MRRTLAIDAPLERERTCGRGIGGVHRGHVPACAKAAFGAGHDQASDLRIGCVALERGDRLRDHVRRQGVELVWSIQRERRDAILHVDQQGI